ncbi:MAG: DUF308 domain-containing protein [Bacilli bacterium]|jgi:uncharacterized membrane protein HdeD (DUF308 family)|nr:MAG: hypothetical protein BWX57_00822 [Tenericutes bacterium ADurb.Bin024]HOM31947.1 DUF308 domain-containing protein [Bacilli bacterium]HPY79066.1 DUF308 domain-containing protein [Bacilli bacterium]HQB96946.1 DUF308 domain-containing protein [Bacilli bacterium]
MRISINTKVSFGVTVFTSVALIIIGAMIVKYNTNLAASLFYLIGIIIALVGFINFLNYISGRKQKVTVSEYLLSILLMIAGILVAIFSESIQAYGLLVIGILFVMLGIYDIVLYFRSKATITLIVGILRIVIGTAFIVSGFSEVLLANDEFSRKLWLIIGYASIVLGVTFLVLDTFQVTE